MKKIVVTEYKTNVSVMDGYSNNQGKIQKVITGRSKRKYPFSEYFVALLFAGYEYSTCSGCGNRQKFSREGKICARIKVSNFNSTCGGIYLLEHPKSKSSKNVLIRSPQKSKIIATEIFKANRPISISELDKFISTSVANFLITSRKKCEYDYLCAPDYQCSRSHPDQ